MMSEALRKPVSDDIPIPDVTNLTTEDDAPVDNLFVGSQRRLLTQRAERLAERLRALGIDPDS